MKRDSICQKNENLQKPWPARRRARWRTVACFLLRHEHVPEAVEDLHGEETGEAARRACG
jgi:hypothetical protein